MIEVTIGGCESSYFAGEQIELTITFTNTNTRPSSTNSTAPASPNPPRSATNHRRGTHSISSAPLPRPPTSPGLHQSFQTPHRPSLSVSSDPPRTRRGFIGFPSAPVHSPRSAQRNAPFNAAVSRAKRLSSSRSLSVNLPPSQLEDASSSNRAPSPSTPDAYAPRSPSVLQPPPRQRVISSEMALPANHPHARKQSVQFNGPQTAVSTRESLPLAPVTDAASPLVPPTPLAPSPLSQSMGYSQSTLASPPPPSPFQTSGQQSRPPSALPPKLGLGIELSSPPRPSVSRSLSRGLRTPSNFNPPGYETLLWAYAQLSGVVELDSTFSRPEAVGHLAAKLAKRPVGCGSLDLKESISNSTASSPLGGLGTFFGFGSPSPIGSTPSRSGFLSSMFSPRPTPVSSAGASASVAPSGGLTTFEPPQSLLAVDLTLAPGESKSFIYRVTLPSELPPTFRGRALRFSYQFVVGTCRGGPHMENQTRLLKIPLRFYNHIPVGRPPPVYDLLWPSRVRSSLLHSAEVEEMGALSSTHSVRLNGRKSNGGTRNGRINAELTTLQQFGRSLLEAEQTVEDQGVEEQFESAFKGCRTAIEIMTRQPSKASYDVNKGGNPVAILTLPKTIFRLGESVHGTIEINCFEDCPISVLKVCVLLEAHESLPARFRTNGKGSGLRRVHGEHHDSLTGHIRRTTFALDIPSDGVPAFRVANEAGDGEQLGGLQWRLRICFLVSEEGLPMVEESGAGEWGETWTASNVFNEGALETVECEVGIVVLPSHTLFASVPVNFRLV